MWYLQPVCTSWQRDPSPVALPEVSSSFSMLKCYIALICRYHFKEIRKQLTSVWWVHLNTSTNIIVAVNINLSTCCQTTVLIHLFTINSQRCTLFMSNSNLWHASWLSVPMCITWCSIVSPQLLTTRVIQSDPCPTNVQHTLGGGSRRGSNSTNWPFKKHKRNVDIIMLSYHNNNPGWPVWKRLMNTVVMLSCSGKSLSSQLTKRNELAHAPEKTSCVLGNTWNQYGVVSIVLLQSVQQGRQMSPEEMLVPLGQLQGFSLHRPREGGRRRTQHMTL